MSSLKCAICDSGYDPNNFTLGLAQRVTKANKFLCDYCQRKVEEKFQLFMRAKPDNEY